MAIKTIVCEVTIKAVLTVDTSKVALSDAAQDFVCEMNYNLENRCEGIELGTTQVVDVRTTKCWPND